MAASVLVPRAPKTCTSGSTNSIQCNDSRMHMGTASTSHASVPPDTEEHTLTDLNHCIALGCLHLARPISAPHIPATVIDSIWNEIPHSHLPAETKPIVGNEASQLLGAQWIRLFVCGSANLTSRSIARVYLLPEDWSRRSISRSSGTLKKALRSLLGTIDISPSSWAGKFAGSSVQHFDPWAGRLDTSLYYLFNNLPSPAPNPEKIKDRYTRRAAYDLLGSAHASDWEEDGQQPLKGLRTRLYPYQARSASLMLEREAAPQLQLDPRLETREAPNGRNFLYCARDGSFLHEPTPKYPSYTGGLCWCVLV